MFYQCSLGVRNGRGTADPVLSVALRILPYPLKARQYWIFGSASMTTEK